MEGKANCIVDFLSRHPIVQLLKYVSVSVKISLKARGVESISDEYLNLVESFLQTNNLPVDMSLDDKVAIKRSSWQFVIQGGQFCNQLNTCLISFMLREGHGELLNQTHRSCNHCGDQKLLQALFSATWWQGISEDCQKHVNTCVLWQRFGRVHPHSAPHPLITDIPMQVVSIDFIGPLDVTHHGF